MCVCVCFVGLVFVFCVYPPYELNIKNKINNASSMLAVAIESENLPHKCMHELDLFYVYV